MKKLTYLLLAIGFSACHTTKIKVDDHSYFYQHNDQPTNPSLSKFKINKNDPPFYDGRMSLEEEYNKSGTKAYSAFTRKDLINSYSPFPFYKPKYE